MAGAEGQETHVGSHHESYGFVTAMTMSDGPAQGSYRETCAATPHAGHSAACLGGDMPSSTPDWSALASKNERLADDFARGGTPDAAQREAGHGDTQIMNAVPWAATAAVRATAPRRSLLRRPSRRAAVGTAAVLAIAGATSLSAVAAQASVRPAAGSSWKIVKQVHAGGFGQFTAVATLGRSAGWAFLGAATPTAWKRSGSSWTKVAFPGKNGQEIVAAGATSASDAWAFGQDGQAAHWNGHSWSTQRTFRGTISSAVVAGPSNVWVFGMTGIPGALGTWHYNGHGWAKVASGRGLTGGSAAGTSDWAFGGTNVARWNGHTWVKTSVKKLLPAKQELNGPSVTSMFAQSKSSVWAVGDGNLQDEGGPVVVLHYNGHSWAKVASSKTGGYQAFASVAPDGHNGLWIPLSTPAGGTIASFMHYAGGQLSVTQLPVASDKIDLQAVAGIPGTAGAIAVGFTHSASSLGSAVVGVILQQGG